MRLLFLLMLFTACMRSGVDRQRLSQYVADEKKSGLSDLVRKGAYTFKLSYKPAALLAAANLSDGFTAEEYEVVVGQFSRAEHFVLTISANAGDTKRRLQESLGGKYDSVYNDLLFRYAAQIKLWCDGKEYACSIAHLENDGNMRDGFTYVLDFDTEGATLSGDRTLRWKDYAFTNDDVELTISADAITSVPTLTSNP